MTPSEQSKEVRRGLRRRRRWRMGIRLNLSLSILLAMLAVGLVNVLSARYHWRMDFTKAQHAELSEKTREILGSLENDVEIVMFFQRGQELFHEVESLLLKYQYVSSRISLELVDPDRHLGRVSELAALYEITEPNVVVFHSEGRSQVVPASALIEYDATRARTDEMPIRKLFTAERAFTSAIYAVSQARRPTVYFLTGHGERQVDNFDPMVGYSSIAKRIERDYINVRELQFGESSRIPDDLDVLVIAGPRRRMAQPEQDLIAAYLERSGRVLLLLDGQIHSGLEPILHRWGVQVGDDVVVDPSRTLTGREIFVTEYEPHPITDPLNGVSTLFHQPRSVSALHKSDGMAIVQRDKPNVTPLAMTSASGWAERNPDQTPLRFDAEVDGAGPVSMAVAVERGAIPDLRVQIRATRMVVIGDSSFVANAALTGGGEDFFMNSLNWLLDRENRLAIEPRPMTEMRLTLSRRQLNQLFLLSVILLPFSAALLGMLVSWKRRH